MLPVTTNTKENKLTYNRIVEPCDLETTKRTAGRMIEELAALQDAYLFGKLRLNVGSLKNDEIDKYFTDKPEKPGSRPEPFITVDPRNRDDVVSAIANKEEPKRNAYKIGNPHNLIIIKSGRASEGVHIHERDIEQIKSFLEKSDINSTLVFTKSNEPVLVVDVTQDGFISKMNDMYRQRAKHRVERAKANIENTDPSKAKPPQKIIDELIEQYDLIPTNSLGKPFDPEQTAQTLHKIISLARLKSHELEVSDELAKLQAEEKPRNFSTRVSASQGGTGLKKA